MLGVGLGLEIWFHSICLGHFDRYAPGGHSDSVAFGFIVIFIQVMAKAFWPNHQVLRPGHRTILKLEVALFMMFETALILCDRAHSTNLDDPAFLLVEFGAFEMTRPRIEYSRSRQTKNFWWILLPFKGINYYIYSLIQFLCLGIPRDALAHPSDIQTVGHTYCERYRFFGVSKYCR